MIVMDHGRPGATIASYSILNLSNHSQNFASVNLWDSLNLSHLLLRHFLNLRAVAFVFCARRGNRLSMFIRPAGNRRNNYFILHIVVRLLSKYYGSTSEAHRLRTSIFFENLSDINIKIETMLFRLNELISLSRKFIGLIEFFITWHSQHLKKQEISWRVKAAPVTLAGLKKRYFSHHRNRTFSMQRRHRQEQQFLEYTSGITLETFYFFAMLLW